jgi:hypothetical protein
MQGNIVLHPPFQPFLRDLAFWRSGQRDTPYWLQS